MCSILQFPRIYGFGNAFAQSYTECVGYSPSPFYYILLVSFIYLLANIFLKGGIACGVVSSTCNDFFFFPSGLYMDRRCVYYRKPLLESGTLGTKGNVQVR